MRSAVSNVVATLAEGAFYVGVTPIAALLDYSLTASRVKTKPLLGSPSFSFVQRQLRIADKIAGNRSSWTDAFATGTVWEGKVKPYGRDIDHRKDVLLQTGITRLRENGLIREAEQWEEQLAQLRARGIKESHWTREGYVQADLHNHFRTSDNMDGLLNGILRRAVDIGREDGSGHIFGVIDFNNFGERSRYAQLERQSGDRAYNLGNALYFPVEDALLVKGQEVPTHEGHLLVLGLDKSQSVKPGRSLDDSLKEARDVNGIAIVDHPFSPHGGLGSFIMDHRDYLERFDGWEIHNGEAAIFRGANQKAKEVYEKEIRGTYQVGALSGSDGHSIYETGTSSTTLQMPPYSLFKGATDVTTALRAAIRSAKDTQANTSRNSKFGALDHIVDLVALTAKARITGSQN